MNVQETATIRYGGLCGYASFVMQGGFTDPPGCNPGYGMWVNNLYIGTFEWLKNCSVPSGEIAIGQVFRTRR
jgi:hypothetical protein